MLASAKINKRMRGVAVVETLIVTPLLLFLILIAAEITNAFVDHNTLTKSVRSAARHLANNSILGTTGTVVLTLKATTETRNLVVYGNTVGAGNPILSGLSVSNVQITYLGSDNVQVTASYPYTGLLGGTLPDFGYGGRDIGLTFNLQATVTMRAL